MKKVLLATVAFVVMLNVTAFAQYSSTEPAQKDQAAQAPLKTIEGIVKLEGGKITFVADKDQKSWVVENPETLKGHEGHHVKVEAHVDADKGSIHIMDVKMLKSSETKKEEVNK